MDRKRKKRTIWFGRLALVLVCTFLLWAPSHKVWGAEEGTEETAFEPFIRMDRDDITAWSRDLDNLRFEKEGLYAFGKTSAKTRLMISCLARKD